MALSVCDTVTGEDGMEILEHGTTAFPAACYYHDVSEKTVPWHWHEEFEVIMVTDGAALISVGGENIELTSGQGIFINAGTVHKVMTASSHICFFKSVCWHPVLTAGRDDSVFWQKYTKGILSEYSPSHFLFEAFGDGKDEAGLYFLDAWKKCAREQEGYELDVRHDLSKILYYASVLQGTGKYRRNDKEIREDRRLKQMMHFIKGHFTEAVTIGGIAEVADISVSECLRCFKQVLGTTPIRYVRSYRLERAAGMLRTGKAVSECCTVCGFDDMSYFAKEFKKQFGCKPTEYKNKTKK